LLIGGGWLWGWWAGFVFMGYANAFDCFVLSMIYLLVGVFTTSLQPKPNSVGKMQSLPHPVGCCCGIGCFLPQLLKKKQPQRLQK